MDITTILIIVAACCGVAFFFPKLPRIAQIVAAIVGILICILVLARFAGVPISF